jgi:hypothetical protein
MLVTAGRHRHTRGLTETPSLTENHQERRCKLGRRFDSLSILVINTRNMYSVYKNIKINSDIKLD